MENAILIIHGTHGIHGGRSVTVVVKNNPVDKRLKKPYEKPFVAVAQGDRAWEF